MMARKFALIAVFSTYGAPAIASDLSAAAMATPRPITSINIADRQVQLVAVTQRARNAGLNNATAQYTPTGYQPSQQMPNTPRPAMVSLDFKVNF